MLAIRSATFDDLSILTEMGRDTFEDAFSKDNSPENMKAYLEKTFNKENVANEIRDIKSHFFLAFDDEIPVGYAKVKVNDEATKVAKETSLELERIYVVKKFHGKKIGTALLETCQDYAKTNNFCWIWLGVWEHNYLAQNFYAKQGFEKFGEHVFQMGDDPQTDWIMKKRISK